MSESTSPKTTRTDRPIERERENRAPWFFWSLVAHVAIFAAVVFLTPVRDMIIEPKKPDLKLSKHRVEELAEHIREQNVEDLKRKVQQLDQIEKMMEQMRQQQRDELKPEQLEDVADAPQDAIEAIEKAIQEQTEALEKLEQVDPEAAKEPFDQQTAEAREDQLEVESAQEQAVNALVLAGQEYEEIRREQTDLATTQLQARDAIEKAQQTRRQIESTESKIESEESHIERLDKLVAQKRNERAATEDRLAKERKQLEDAQQKQAEAKQQLDDAKNAEQEAKQALDADAQNRELVNEHKQAERRTSDAQKQVERMDKAVDRAQKAKDAAEKRLERKQEDVEKYEKQAEQRKAANEQRKQELEQARQQLEQEVADAQDKQAEALDEQKKILAKVNQVRKQQLEAQDAEPQQQVAEQVPPQESQPLSDNPLELFKQAQQQEAEITEDYREIRASELAKIQNMTLAEAMGRVDVATPKREPVNEKALEKPVDTAEKLEEYKKEFQKTAQQMDGMVATAEAMAMAAQRVSQEMGDEMAMAMRIEQEATFDEYAAETADAKAVDFTANMGPIGEGQSPMGMPGIAPPGTGQGDMKMKPGVGQSTGLAQQYYSQWKVAKPERTDVHPEIERQDILQAQPGRVIGEGGVQTDWLFVDGWYILGPFPNEGRRNIHKKFPPETVIDLDATYIGRGGRPIQWEYYKSTRPMVVPDGVEPYTIWYAYTEVEFDQARDMWVAIGSDDRSDIWLNGNKIWASADAHKPWRPGEGFRKVRFQAGRNTILYRIENGQHGMGFSFVLHTAPPTAE